jgi:hypothetical protein
VSWPETERGAAIAGEEGRNDGGGLWRWGDVAGPQAAAAVDAGPPPALRRRRRQARRPGQ